MIENVEIKFSNYDVNYTLTPQSSDYDDNIVYEIATMIAEFVGMANINPTIVINQIKGTCEIEDENNNNMASD